MCIFCCRKTIFKLKILLIEIWMPSLKYVTTFKAENFIQKLIYNEALFWCLQMSIGNKPAEKRPFDQPCLQKRRFFQSEHETMIVST